MIRVNLLADKKKRKKGAAREVKAPPSVLLTLILVTLTTLLVSGIVSVVLRSKVSQLQSQSETNKGVLANLSRRIEEMKRFENLNREFQQRSALIENLRKSQSIPARLLDNVSALVPDGVWLSGLSYRDSRATLEGYAFTNMDIVSYVENLKKSGAVTDVYLEESKETEIEKVAVYKFKLNFKVQV
jgi:type IV pilus assembly protein PilN